MTIEECAAMTRMAIEDEGIDELLPTAFYPDRREIRVLEGAPGDTGLDSAVLEWAARNARGNEEWLISFRVNDATFKVVRCRGSVLEERVFSVSDIDE